MKSRLGGRFATSADGTHILSTIQFGFGPPPSNGSCAQATVYAVPAATMPAPLNYTDSDRGIVCRAEGMRLDIVFTAFSFSVLSAQYLIGSVTPASQIQSFL